MILPSLFFPPAYYFSIIKQHAYCEIEIFESFPKQTLRNRCFVLGNEGVLRLSIPVENYRNHTKTKDIKLIQDDSWKSHLIKSIQTCYGKSPYYVYYSEDIFSAIRSNTNFLIDYNYNCLKLTLNILKIEADIKYTTDFVERFEKNAVSLLFDLKSHQQSRDLLPYNKYRQLFFQNENFISGLSILDLIFNQGPDAFKFI